MKLAYWLPISWNDYLQLPIHVRYAMFNALNEIRKEAGPSVTGQSRQDRKQGLQ